MFYQKSIMQHILIICSVAGTNTQHVEIQRQPLFSNSPLLYGITFSLFLKASYPDSPGKDTGMGKPFPSPGDLPDPEIEPGSPALQADSLLLEPPRKPPVTPIRGILSQVMTAIRIHIDCEVLL